MVTLRSPPYGVVTRLRDDPISMERSPHPMGPASWSVALKYELRGLASSTNEWRQDVRQ